MKKIVSILLAVLMLFSVLSVGVSAEGNTDLVITVANDLHYNYHKSAAHFTGTYTDDQKRATGTGQLPLESELIIDEFLRRAAENESSVVLIPGDLTDRGLLIEHEVMGAKFAEFEKQTGKEVYVVPGNHDYVKNGNERLSSETAREIYAESGYNQAIAHDTKTASYVVDLNDEYRLIAIDSAYKNLATLNQGLDKELYNWIEQQAIKGQADGKKMIAMTHFNLLKHMYFIDQIHPDSVMEPSLNLPELFAKYNIKYNFVGHTHEHDIVSYTGSNGVTIYDVVTTSLNANPCAYRVVSFGDKVTFETRYVDSVDTSSLKGIIPDTSYQLATEDFEQYTYNMFKYGIANTIINYVSADKIKSLLGITAESNAELSALIDSIIPRVKESVNMPLYKEYETVEGFSVESIIKEHGCTIPESDYETILDFASDLYLAHIKGDENFGVLTPEFSIATSCLNAVFIYALEEVTAEQYAQVMSIVCEFLGAEIPVDFFKYAGSGIKKAEGIDILVTAVISPLALEFLVDEGTPDNNVTLEGYDAPAAPPIAEEELGFFGKIKKFFSDLFAYFLRIIGFKR